MHITEVRTWSSQLEVTTHTANHQFQCSGTFQPQTTEVRGTLPTRLGYALLITMIDSRSKHTHGRHPSWLAKPALITQGCIDPLLHPHGGAGCPRRLFRGISSHIANHQFECSGTTSTANDGSERNTANTHGICPPNHHDRLMITAQPLCRILGLVDNAGTNRIGYLAQTPWRSASGSTLGGPYTAPRPSSARRKNHETRQARGSRPPKRHPESGRVRPTCGRYAMK
jgi:hypothetical protein